MNARQVCGWRSAPKLLFSNRQALKRRRPEFEQLAVRSASFKTFSHETLSYRNGKTEPTTTPKAPPHLVVSLSARTIVLFDWLKPGPMNPLFWLALS